MFPLDVKGHQYGHLIMNCKLPLRTRGRGNKSDKGKGIVQEEERSQTMTFEDGVQINAEIIQTKEQGDGDTPQERQESSPEHGTKVA